MSPADFVTVDVVPRPATGNLLWRRRSRAALAQRPAGLRAATVNHANDGTQAVLPSLPPGSALVCAWDSPEAAAAAWRGPLGRVLDVPGRFSMDAEVVRARFHRPGHTWHGWVPTDEGARPLDAEEPLAVVVHGVLRRRDLLGFLRNNVHAASRARFHPGHRGSVDVSSQLPFEHTSISLWRTRAAAEDFAYQPGGHHAAMSHALRHDTHRTGVFLRLHPVASSGTLGRDEPAYPDLPAARRG